MPDINWSENAPPTTASAGLGAQEFQSLKTAIRTGLNAEHTWDPSGVGVGVHRLGSARAYYGPQSLVSSTGTDGRLMVTSDSSRLFHVGSAGTMLLGGAGVLSMGSQPPGGQRFYWAIETGLSVPGIIAFPNSGFSGVPFVTTSLVSNSVGKEVALMLGALSATQFVVLPYSGTSQQPNSCCSVTWMSIGTRTT